MSRLLVQHEEDNELIFDSIHLIDFNYFMAIMNYLKEEYWNGDMGLKEELIYDNILSCSSIKYDLHFYSLYKWLNSVLSNGTLDIILTKIISDEHRTQEEYKRFINDTLGEVNNNVKGYNVKIDQTIHDVQRAKRIFQQLFNAMNQCVDKHDRIKLKIST